MKSTLNREGLADLEGVIPCVEIIDLYNAQLGIDVSEYFQGIENVHLYRCSSTAYRFFYPLSLSANSSFYEKMQKFPWYYMQGKWEYSKGLEFIKPGNKVLEIGCGEGNFLKLLKNRHVDGIGVEINAESAEMGKLQGVKILQKDISEFALSAQESFDVVCNFQVVEHNADIYHFILSNIVCLKPGGLLMMSVPDSSSLINRNITAHALNLPPHHMSLWNKHTLSKLPTIYKNIRIKAIFHEPLQEYHFDLYCKEFFNTFIDRYWGWRSFIYRTGLNKVIRYSLKRIRPNLKGHTLLAVYQKI